MELFFFYIETVHKQNFNIEMFWYLTVCKQNLYFYVLMLNYIFWNRTDYLYKNGFGVNLQRLVYHKNPTNQPTNQPVFMEFSLSFQHLDLFLFGENLTFFFKNGININIALLS